MANFVNSTSKRGFFRPIKTNASCRHLWRRFGGRSIGGCNRRSNLWDVGYKLYQATGRLSGGIRYRAAGHSETDRCRACQIISRAAYRLIICQNGTWDECLHDLPRYVASSSFLRVRMVYLLGLCVFGFLLYRFPPVRKAALAG